MDFRGLFCCFYKDLRGLRWVKNERNWSGGVIKVKWEWVWEDTEEAFD